MKRCIRPFLTLLATMSCAIADGDLASRIETKFTGLGSIEAGQVVKGENRQAREWETAPDISHVWYQRYYMQMGLKARINERADVVIAAEGRISYSWRIQQEFYDDLQPKFLFYPHHMEGSYFFGESDRPWLRIGAGIFPYKYNPDVRNLGEYLFRTGTYPPYIAGEYDFPLARLAGFKVSSEFVDDLKFDLMFLSEHQQLPLNDWGIALIGEYTIARAFTIGGGVFFSHLLAVTDQYTTPRVANNIARIDTIDAANAAYDTLFYTYRGTKFMARMAFDPKAVIHRIISGDDGIDVWRFGKNDLRLYAEVGLIGWKNYPGYYEYREERLPVVVGWNVPAFKLLDVLAVELEYFGSKIPNSYQEVFYRRTLPIPDVQRMQDPAWDEYRGNQWKWSVYANKRLADCFTLSAQVAKDHTRLLRHDQKNQDLEESMHKAGDWAWVAKCAFDF